MTLVSLYHAPVFRKITFPEKSILSGKSQFSGKSVGVGEKPRSFSDSVDQNISEYFYFVPRKNLTVAKTPKMHGIFHILMHGGALRKKFISTIRRQKATFKLASF